MHMVLVLKNHAVPNYIISNINCVEYLKQMCNTFHCYFEQQMLIVLRLNLFSRLILFLNLHLLILSSNNHHYVKGNLCIIIYVNPYAIRFLPIISQNLSGISKSNLQNIICDYAIKTVMNTFFLWLVVAIDIGLISKLVSHDKIRSSFNFKISILRWTYLVLISQLV